MAQSAERAVPAAGRAARLGEPLWDGRPGRVEVWYATFTDDVTGDGYWLHYETVAPTSAGKPPYHHGWASVFPRSGRPRVERFGPDPVPERGHEEWFSAGESVVAPGRLRGRTESFGWDLSFDDSEPPLFTFGRPVWERHLLPGAQCVPWPTARFSGTFTTGERQVPVSGHGALARIYGHSNAQRWCWLHADLPDGGVIEIVSATARRPGLRRLPPLAMIQLRLPGSKDRPRVPALAALLLRTRIGRDGFSISGPVGAHHLRVEVSLHPDRSVALTYEDPDGSTATCTNSEVADATVVLRRLLPRPRIEKTWRLEGRAHAEIGRRP